MELYDLAPNRGGLIFCAPTHKAASTLAQRGLKGVCTLKSLLYAPVFQPIVHEALEALADDEPGDWPDGFPYPGAKAPAGPKWARARAALNVDGERGAFEALEFDLLKWIDITQGRQGWTAKTDARYAVVFLDEAGQVPAEQVEDLRQRCDRLILLGDYGQNKPIATEEDREARRAQGKDLSGLFSALHPQSLERLDAKVMRLHRNFRSANRIADVPGVVERSGSLRDFNNWVAKLPENERGCFEFHFDAEPPLEPMRKGAPLFVLSHQTRLWQNRLFLERARLVQDFARPDNLVAPGMVVVVGLVRNQAVAAAAPLSLVKGSRWIVREADGGGRCTIENLTKPGTFLHGVRLRLAEFDDKYTAAYAESQGHAYPAIGVPLYSSDVVGRLGHAMVYATAQSDTVDEVIVETSGIDWKCWRGLTEADGAPAWKSDLVTCIGRARFVAHLWNGR